MRGFRVYDTTNKKYVTNEFSWVVTANGELHELDGNDLIGRPDCIKEDDTGETDRNGKRIFEGDIVKLGTGKIRFVFYGVTTFRHTNYGKYAKEFDYKDKGYEVVGNIHDNPELLGDK